jgi:hypothetical protein
VIAVNWSPRDVRDLRDGRESRESSETKKMRDSIETRDVSDHELENTENQVRDGMKKRVAKEKGSGDGPAKDKHESEYDHR